MPSVLNQPIGVILDNYADVIEGGNSYRGSGTVYRGIPGTHPYDDGLRSGDDTPLAVVGDSTSTTTFDVASSYSWLQSRWVPQAGPGFWALCNTAGDNFGQARKITGWDNTTKVFTVAPAFTDSPTAADSMVILQGFKRIPNLRDSSATDAGRDRFFHLRANPGADEGRSGRGVRTKRTDLELRLRILKHARELDAMASALENVAILSAAVESSHSPDHRDGTYTRALWAEDAPAVAVDDDTKVEVLQRFTLIYQINAELL